VAVLLGLALAGCGGSPRCPEVDEEALAQRVAEIVLERLGRDAASEADKQIAGEAEGRGASAPVAELWPTDSGLPGADEPRSRVPTEGAPWRGAAEPLVTIVAFIDFQCPYCSKAQDSLTRLLEEFPDEVRLVFRHHPLDFHPEAMPAAEACAEAFAQGGNDAFWRMHDLVVRNPRALSRSRLEDYAREAGLRMSRFRRALDDHTHRPAIRGDVELALSLGASGTPAFFVNGRKLSGAQPYAAFEEIVREEIDLGREAMRRGARRDRIYEVAMMEATDHDGDGGADEHLERATEREAIHHVPVGDSPSLGPGDALVTIVMFADVQCPFCVRAYHTAKTVKERFGDNARLVWKNHPLPFHDEAMQSHRALMEARAQKGDEAAFRMLELMFEDLTRLEIRDLERHARTLKLSLPRFRKALKKKKHSASIESDLALARRVGVRGTPTFFINGVKVVGAGSYFSFFQAASDALERAESLVESGIPRDRVYAEIIRDGQGGPEDR
jgi:protein-disulfide isomerase